MRLPHRLIALCLLGWSLGGGTHADVTDRWATFRHDYQRTGRSSIIGPQKLDTLKWKRPVAPLDPSAGSLGIVRTSPAFGINGEIYVTANYEDGGDFLTVLTSFDPFGVVRWSTPLGVGQTDSSPSVSIDNLYIGAASGGIKSVATATGAVVWTSAEATQLVLASPALLQNPDGTFVFYGTHALNGVFSGLNAVSGNTVWTAQVITGAVDSSAAIGRDDGTLYFGSQGDGGSLTAVNPETGEALWSHPTDGPVIGTPALSSDGTLYFGTINGVMYALNTHNGGSEKWRKDGYGAFNSSAALGRDDLVVYIGNDDDHLYAFDAHTGAQVGAFSTKIGGVIDAGAVTSSPAVGGDGTVYFGSDNGAVYAVSPDLKVLKSYFVTDTHAAVVSSPSIGPDGTLFIGADDGYLYAFQSHPAIAGDLNQDGKVSIADAIMALAIVIGRVTPTPDQVRIGDLAPPGHPDGVIDISDAVLILRRAVGLF